MLPRLKPTAPDEWVKSFRVEPGFKVEIVAAEPLVTDAVAMEWDENGRLFVCEMWNYPGNPQPGEPLGRVRMLEDINGDGKYDKAAIFAENLKWPSGVFPWDGGVYVISSPDIWYLKDTNGDGVADVRVKVFTGFTGENYAVPNTLRWGLDNHLYGSSSYRGGSVKRLDQPDAEAVQLRGRDWRFDPRTRKFSAVTASGEFGQSFDDWGNRFTGNANTMFIHGVLPAEYLARNPNFPSPDTSERAFQGFPDIYSISEPEPWRLVRQKFWSRFVNTSHNMRESRFPDNELTPRGHLTSGSGYTVFRGSAFPEEYRGNLFFGEPANNIVGRLVLEPDGVGFKPTRPDETTKREFIASSDVWFRPVNFNNGPDGCLYIACMYREVIEDESAIPDDILKYLDLYSGRDRGRILRVSPENFKTPAPPHLGKSRTTELVAALAHPDAWWRETAQRLIHERQDKAAIDPLQKLARRAEFPLARLHALYALQGLGALDEKSLLAAMNHPEARLREHGAKLAEAKLDSAAVRAKLLSLADDPAPRVRFQTALSLGGLDDEKALSALARIARRDAADKWIRSAVLTSVPTRAGRLLKALLADEAFRAQDHGLIGHLAQIAGARNDPREVEEMLNLLVAPALQSHGRLQRIVLRQLADGLNRAGSSILGQIGTAKGYSSVNAMLKAAFAEAEQTALDAGKDDQERAEAIQLLAFASFSESQAAYDRLLDAAQPAPVQLAALRALASVKDAAIAPLLLKNWPAHSPAIRNEVIEALLRRPERLSALLDAIENSVITVNTIDQSQRQALLRSKDAAIHDRAEKLLGGPPDHDRQQVIDRYRAALAKLKGDPARGAEVFDKNCAACHRHSPRENVGPRLGGLTDRSPDALLISMLDPNREVKAAYLNYILATKDDQEFSGIIVNETATTVTIRRAGGEEDAVLRKNIKSLNSSALSMMPDGLESGVTEQQMADLMQYLQVYKD